MKRSSGLAGVGWYGVGRPSRWRHRFTTMITPLTVVIVLLVLACGAGLCFAIIKRRIRFQFSLRSLLAVTAVVALVLGLMRVWSRNIITLHVPRIEARPGVIDSKTDALDLGISHCWGRTVMRVIPRNDFDEASRAELFWLDSGNLRHETISEKGRVAATTFSGPKEWPLLIGVVEYHPKAIHVVARHILLDGRAEGLSVFYDTNDPSLEGGVEKWGQSFLESVGRDRQITR